MNPVERTVAIFMVALAAGACNRPPPPSEGGPSASAGPIRSGAAPTAAASGVAPATITGPNGESLRREPKHDAECNGKKAYTGDTRTALPSTGCTGPMLVHFSMKHPDSGEVVDGEASVFCCP